MMEWYWIAAIIAGSVAAWLVLSNVFYKQFFKRFYDIVISGTALVVLSPLLLLLTLVGTVAMRGNPFFVQPRPGKINRKTGREEIFSLVKFRSMDNRKDSDGNLLPDEVRLNGYGKLLRKTSLDELPELLCVFIGKMSLVGPRPLLVRYLPRYTAEQRHRHDVRPGLTGYAQAHGRNAISWEERFSLDVWYTRNISFIGDIKILFDTAMAVLKREGISSETSATMEEFTGSKTIIE